MALVLGDAARALPARADGAGCGGSIDRELVSRCSVRESPAVWAKQRAVDAAAARRDGARAWLPQNPVLALSGARRRGGVPTGTATNWTATLSQEIEISGGRGVRMEAAETAHQRDAEWLRNERRSRRAAALTAYFDARAAAELSLLARSIEERARRVARAASEAAARGGIAAVDADLADHASVRASEQRIEAEEQEALAAVSVRAAVGRAATDRSPIVGPLEPLPAARAIESNDRVAHDAPPVRAARLDARRYELEASVFRRARVPNPTVQLFAQNDGFDERVLGVGVALPLLLPHPVGRSHAGEIAAAGHLADASRAEATYEERSAQADLVRAKASFLARGEAAALYTEERRRRAMETLSTLADAVASGKIAVREAVLTERVVVELLVGSVHAKRAECVASVELLRVSGSLDGEEGGR